jgi:hypothetical protein
MMERDGYHHSTVLIGKGRQSQVVQFFPRTRAEKHAYIRDIADLAKRISSTSVIMIGEIWTASLPIEKLNSVVHAVDVTDRGEALSLIGLDRDGTCIEIRVGITRQSGKIVFAPECRFDGRSINLMAPFREALGLEKQPHTSSPTVNSAVDGSDGHEANPASRSE